MHGHAPALDPRDFPTVRPSQPLGSPGVEWAWLRPKRDAYEVWTVNCPTGCGGRVEVWEVDGARFVLAPEPKCGCSSADQAWRMAVSTDLPDAHFMPVYEITKGLVEDVAHYVSLPGVAPAWDGTLRFKSDHSRLRALEIRLGEAGADDAVRALAIHALRVRLAGTTARDR
jgi:hypothetical protein